MYKIRFKFSVSKKIAIFFLIDDNIRKSWIALMKIKNDLYEKIQKWHRIVNLKTDEKAIIFKNDNVIEYKKFEKLIEINDIKMKYITVYTSEKNGVAKRFNRTIVQMIRSMLIWIELSQFFWNETICTVNYFRNLMSAKQNKKKSSNEL